MKYIFTPEEIIGTFPIKEFQVCWYDMTHNGECFDESFYNPEDFLYHDLTYIDADEDIETTDKSRVFARHINGDMYELRFHKIEDWQKYSTFDGGREYEEAEKHRQPQLSQWKEYEIERNAESHETLMEILELCEDNHLTLEGLKDLITKTDLYGDDLK